MHVRQLCFVGNYIVDLLLYAFKFDLKEKVKFTKKLKGQQVDWTRGALLFEAINLPHKQKVLPGKQKVRG